MSAPPADARRVAPGTLSKHFFARPTDELARDLMGVWLFSESTDGLCGGPIVETEAYGGPEDLASHARAGRTRRTMPMFGPVGHAYVYLVYGMHDCLNVVGFAPPAEAGAVLIRAIEPAIGIDLMRARRGRPHDLERRLCAGPARLCQALGVDRSLDGHDLMSGQRLWLATPDVSAGALEVKAGTRVGVESAGGDWSERPWRFWQEGNPSVSRTR